MVYYQLNLCRYKICDSWMSRSVQYMNMQAFFLLFLRQYARWRALAFPVVLWRDLSLVFSLCIFKFLPCLHLDGCALNPTSWQKNNKKFGTSPYMYIFWLPYSEQSSDFIMLVCFLYIHRLWSNANSARPAEQPYNTIGDCPYHIFTDTAATVTVECQSDDVITRGCNGVAYDACTSCRMSLLW